MSNNRISFLFGAGISVAVGMPSTKDITMNVLREEYFNKIKNNGTHYDEFPQEVLFYIKQLKNIAVNNNPHTKWYDPNGTKRHSVNYEDIYYMLIQVLEHVSGDFNTYGKMLVDLTEYKAIVDKWQFQGTHAHYSKELYFSILAEDYIWCVVVDMLKTHANNLDKLKLERLIMIVHACKDEQFSHVDIFTLNHDLVMEQLLKDNGIEYTDGFENIDGNIRKWNPKIYDAGDANKISLFKLHGSLDWKYLVKKTPTEKVRHFLAVTVEDNKHGTGIFDSERNEYGIGRENELLIGSENKIREYMIEKYWELHFRFRQRLRETDALVVSGYSFGDSSINSQLLEWLINENGKKLLVIDNGDEEEFVEQLGYEFKMDYSGTTGLWESLKQDGKIEYIGDGVENQKWSDMEGIIHT